MAHEKGPSDGGEGTIAFGRFSTRRIVRRLFLAAVIAGLCFSVLFREKADTVSIEDVVRQYLSRNSKEQIRLEENRLRTLEAGLRQCASLKERPISQFDSTRTNPRAVKSAASVVIRNATIIDGDGSVDRGFSILLSQGVIREISQNLEAPDNAKIVDVGGRYVTPGLIDMVFYLVLRHPDCSIPMPGLTHFLSCSAQMILMRS
jgi:hypothetical protein